jgi:hypothetical protein
MRLRPYRPYGLLPAVTTQQSPKETFEPCSNATAEDNREANVQTKACKAYAKLRKGTKHLKPKFKHESRATQKSPAQTNVKPPKTNALQQTAHRLFFAKIGGISNATDAGLSSLSKSSVFLLCSIHLIHLQISHQTSKAHAANENLTPCSSLCGAGHGMKIRMQMVSPTAGNAQPFCANKASEVKHPHMVFM